MGSFSIDITYLEESAKDILTSDLIARLSPLLEADFCKRTGLTLGKGLYFFITAFKAEIITEKTAPLSGDLICPDSTGLDIEVQWEEGPDGTLKAWWRKLNVDYIRQYYGKVTPFQLPLPNTPFPVIWVHFWESHLPDLYIFLKLFRPCAEVVKERLDRFLEVNAPAYFKINVSQEMTVDFHIAWAGDEKSFLKFIESLILELSELHE